ncbi:MAG: ABC transporter ATP-binding protein [Spirochaetales bacterium]|jgi:branched-chain amino acid transport system ATP-binding protein|nr:ABC transporter ATP-binding protein [Spirochaetales bacterium]
MPLLHIKDISLSFGGLKAVDSVNIRVDEGEIVSLIGPNGAGKTTVFNILTGIYTVDSGEIFFEGNAIQNKIPQDIVEAGIARTFQNIRLFRNMRVIENVLIGSHIREPYNFFQAVFRTRRFRDSERENTLKAVRLLREVGLLARTHDYAANLPYGEQRKLEIARALATGAKLILLDEPAAGMNPQESEELLRFILSLRGRGYTILMIEHDMSVVMNISDRIYVLDYGKLISEGLPRQVANDPKVIEAYLGGVPDAAENNRA